MANQFRLFFSSGNVAEAQRLVGTDARQTMDWWTANQVTSPGPTIHLKHSSNCFTSAAAIGFGDDLGVICIIASSVWIGLRK
jgi:hypothetical protein